MIAMAAGGRQTGRSLGRIMMQVLPSCAVSAFTTKKPVCSAPSSLDGIIRPNLPYQAPNPGGATGRYIGVPDKGDISDVHDHRQVEMRDARRLSPSPSLDTKGFQLCTNPSKVTDFRDDEEVKRVYYKEMEEIVKKATGASRVVVFDHTVRESSVASLNNLGAKGVSAGSVARVHCDYTEDSAPRRLKQLASADSYTGVRLTQEEVEAALEKRFAFVNVWRNIRDDSPVMVKPLAVCDTSTVSRDEHFLYELRYGDRTGHTYSLCHSDAHKWFYYPQMVKDECLVFKVFDKHPDGPRFVFHTAFDDPTAPSDAPDRHSIEARAIAFWDEQPPKPVFYDMIHSNNAARVRLWLHWTGLTDMVETKLITYADLQSPEYQVINPLKKVPALRLSSGKGLAESQVILQYLEDKYGHLSSRQVVLDMPEQRARVNLLCRVHDVYIASPNNTQPNFAHTQGAMYLGPLPGKHCPPERVMDRPTRAAKLAEIWKRLHWLESHMVGPYLGGDFVTHADFTWFPTCVFMEYMLPRVFGWPEVFREKQHFPRLATWYSKLEPNPVFGQVRQDIWDFWTEKDHDGQFCAIREETKDTSYKWTYP